MGSGKAAVFFRGLEERVSSQMEINCFVLGEMALTSPTSGGRSVGIDRWRTKAPKFVVCLFFVFRENCLFPSLQGVDQRLSRTSQEVPVPDVHAARVHLPLCFDS
jgi:hypothetical protein